MKSFLEKTLTRIPMYLLVNGALALLILYALVCSLLGTTPFTPLEIIASTFVFSGVSIAASYVLGKLYGVHSHLQSALITGLILALIFTPSHEKLMLVQYALIAVIAMASKFVIAPRGRHIFNPAAFGAFVGGIIGLEYASWWIGAPAFVVIATLCSIAILYKTRQLLLGTIFVGLAAIFIIIVGLSHGLALPGLISSALLSWPLIFMAGFMLSEPLTLPPRRSQRIILAILVAVIAGLPFDLGWFNTSPAFALLVGNVFALVVAWPQRKDLGLVLRERRQLTPSTIEFVFSSPSPVMFQPGQYVELTLPHSQQDARGIRRSFSITSLPGESELHLGIKFYNPSSTFKEHLWNLPLGTAVQTTGINGDFTLPKDPTRKLLFIAGGIGVTPFISQIKSLAGSGADVTLLYFVRDEQEIAYAPLLDASGFTIRYFVAKSSTSRFEQAPTLTRDILARFVPDLAHRAVYISGSPAMVANAKDVIGNDAHHIHSDYFSGY